MTLLYFNSCFSHLQIWHNMHAIHARIWLSHTARHINTTTTMAAAIIMCTFISTCSYGVLQCKDHGHQYIYQHKLQTMTSAPVLSVMLTWLWIVTELPGAIPCMRAVTTPSANISTFVFTGILDPHARGLKCS